MITGIRLIKHCFALGAILFLAACSAQEALGTIPVSTATPSSTEAVLISPSLNTPTATRSPAPTATASPSVTPTLTPTLRPTPYDCDAGFVVFSATGDGIDNRDKTGIYLACTDGTFLQQIVSVAEVLPDEDWYLTDLAVSPDGKKLAFVAMGKYISQSVPAPNRIYLVDMPDYSTSVIYHSEEIEGIGDISWSPSGDYLAYMTLHYYSFTRIEVLHIATQTISMVVDNDPDALADLAWLHDGTQIFFTTHTGDPPSLRGYLANIRCETSTHLCSTTDQIELDWLDTNNVSYQFSLDPNSSNIVGKYYTNDSGYVIEIRDLFGSPITTVNLNEQISTLSYGFYPPSASPDGSRIAFAARVKEGEQRNVFILSLSDKTLMNLTDRLHLGREIDADEVLWIP